MDKQLLTAIFSKPIDGGCSNAYAPIVSALERVKKNGSGTRKFSYNQLLQALKPLAKIWDIQIDDVISQ